MQEILSYFPAVNAVLISTSGVLILRGVAAVKRGDETLHKKLMLLATAFAGLFLVLYLTRIYLGGLTPFAGPELVKWIYFFILFTHVVLAMVQTPLVFATLWYAFRDNVASHKKIARITYPIWVYVSFTGVAVFGLLHYPYN